MKLKQFTKVITAGSFGVAFCFLASCKKEASTTQKDEPAKEKPAPTASSDKVPVYIVTVSGKG